jgi:hypothetical protein
VPKVDPLPLAVRVYPIPEHAPPRRQSQKRWRRPDAMLVVDTETRVDTPQGLTFACYRFIDGGRCLEEGLFYGDDLPRAERAVLRRYVATHPADTAPDGVADLQLLTRRAFLEKFYQAGYKGRALLVAFNWPFDLSRLADEATHARHRFAGGFSFRLWAYADNGTKRERENKYRPRVAVKHIDSKRALIGFTGRREPDAVDLMPDDAEIGETARRSTFRGHFLDLRTLSFALTDRGHSLKSACQAFGVEHPKQSAIAHGRITPAYIDYNRRDVLATWELANKLLEEYDRHPISLQPTKAFSPASIGKSYLRAMGIPPVLERQPDFPAEYLGHAQSAFFGGRTGAHIRRLAVPVVYTDFLSMYPTVNSLMGLWRFVTAKRVRVIKHCKDKVIRFLEQHTKAEAWLNPKLWPLLTAFVRVVPDGDVLPLRARFAPERHDWGVAVSHLYAGDPPNDSLWFALPDVVASIILTGRVPQIIDAFQIEPDGTLDGLRPAALRGVIPVDPTRQDFFTTVIEERQRLKKRKGLADIERKRLDKALKVLANATSYGIYAEMQRQESDARQLVTCQGIDAEPYFCRVKHPDTPGEYCFPPFASLITAAARLMLALLESRVTALGGTYAMEDTDSMAIVATKTGGLVPCPGGRERTPEGTEAERALSWSQVDQIAADLSPLNPFDRDAIPGSVLKIEKDNVDPVTGQRRQVWCYAISAKRYALCLKNTDGELVLLRAPDHEADAQGRADAFASGRANNDEDRWSEHGLGHLLNPTDPTSEDRDWIATVWSHLVNASDQHATAPLPFDRRPAVSRMTVSSPLLLHPFSALNRRKPYRTQIKPFNFLTTCHVRALGHPVGTTPERFHLIAPYETDPRRWTSCEWTDRYSGKTYRITTTGAHGSRTSARVKTYRDVIEEYAFHPEIKCAAANGEPCSKATVGLLQRRHIRIGDIEAIGKESNSLEDVEVGLVHDEHNVYTTYPDPQRSVWATKIVPALKRADLAPLEKACKGRLSRRALSDIRAGRSTPHRKNQEFLASVVRKLGLL